MVVFKNRTVVNGLRVFPQMDFAFSSTILRLQTVDVYLANSLLAKVIIIHSFYGGVDISEVWKRLAEMLPKKDTYE